MNQATTNRQMTAKEEAKLIIMEALPNLPDFALQRFAGAAEMLAALRAEEEKPEKPAS